MQPLRTAKALALLTVAFSLVLSPAAFSAPPWGKGNEKPNNGKPNRPPSIQGSPTVVAEVNAYFAFQPTARDRDGDELTFSISNKPSWAAFDSARGFLSGYPSPEDAGVVTHNIVISVTDGVHTVSLDPFSISVTGSAANAPPVISGSPAPEAMVSDPYSFTPTASDPDDDALTFAIANAPPWASFDTASGRLHGTPQEEDLGVYENIRISVSDGVASDATGDFSITVVDMSYGTITLSWSAPTENTDGSALTNLSGYRIYYGTASGGYGREVAIEDSGITTMVIEDLTPGTWYFAATALTADGLESSLSNEVARVIE